jgi:SAM-dependent methyltransferase
LERIGYSYCGVDANTTDAPDIVCAIDEALPPELLQRGPFHFVLCTEVLEHVADWSAAFANFERLLAPGGRVLITAPHFYQLHEEPFDFWRPTLYAIRHYARRAGLQPLYCNSAGDAWDVLGTVLSNCRFAASSPRLFDRALAKAVRVGARLASRALVSRKVQRSVRVEGTLYLANIAVLEKLNT